MHGEVAELASCYFYYPRLVCLIGVRDDERSTVNFAPVTWATPLSSDPPLYGVCLTPQTHTHHLVNVTGEFTLSFVSQDQADLASTLGTLSGRRVDKVKSLDLQVVPGQTLTTPRLACAYAAVECNLIERHHVGDQTLVVGEIMGLFVADNCFDGDGVLRTEQVRPLLYLGNQSFTTIESTPISPPTRK